MWVSDKQNLESRSWIIVDSKERQRASLRKLSNSSILRVFLIIGEKLMYSKNVWHSKHIVVAQCSRGFYNFQIRSVENGDKRPAWSAIIIVGVGKAGNFIIWAFCTKTLLDA